MFFSLVVMASFPPAVFLPFASCLVMLISHAHSQSCASQTKFSNNKLYTNCIELPTFNSTLHYTYNASNSSLSIAFTARPPNPDGWVGWGVNLNGTGMAGAQALVAMKTNGSVVTVKKFSLESYDEINETKTLGVYVWEVSGEWWGGELVIQASVKVPGRSERLNQIWQVGPGVRNGFPVRHEFGDENLNSKGMINLVASAVANDTIRRTNPTITAGISNNNDNGNNTSSGYVIKGINMGYRIGLFLHVFCNFFL